MMKRTISGMIGAGSLAHNRRDFVAENVDPDRVQLNICYKNENLKEVYKELFDDATERYNVGKRKDRQIANYYEKIRQGKQEKLFHEVIFQIGNREDMAVGTLEGNLAVKVLDEYVKDFQKRNPTLRVFSCYQTLRGRSMIELKEKAVLNCSEAELGIALVPVIAPGVNDMQVGDILKFAMDHMPFVRGVHFQPISYFGRCSQQRPQAPITIPKMLKLIEEQTDGLMKSKDFAGGGAENPYCSFHASYLKKGERELKLLEKKSGRGCCCTTSDNSRQYVENQWSYSTKKFDDGEMTQTDALDEFLIRVHNETFAVSGMIFQDAWNLDLERLKRCYICEVDSDYGMVPFCAYNLTNSKGIYLYRK